MELSWWMSNIAGWTVVLYTKLQMISLFAWLVTSAIIVSGYIAHRNKWNSAGWNGIFVSLFVAYMLFYWVMLIFAIGN